MNMNRRLLLKGTATAGVVGVAVASGLLTPRAALAAWPKAAFDADNLAAIGPGQVASGCPRATAYLQDGGVPTDLKELDERLGRLKAPQVLCRAQ